MDAIIDRLVVTIHSSGATRLPPDEIRAIVTACVAAMKGEREREDRRTDDVRPMSAYQRQIGGG